MSIHAPVLSVVASGIIGLTTALETVAASASMSIASRGSLWTCQLAYRARNSHTLAWALCVASYGVRVRGQCAPVLACSHAPYRQPGTGQGCALDARCGGWQGRCIGRGRGAEGPSRGAGASARTHPRHPRTRSREGTALAALQGRTVGISTGQATSSAGVGAVRWCTEDWVRLDSHCSALAACL